MSKIIKNNFGNFLVICLIFDIGDRLNFFGLAPLETEYVVRLSFNK